MSRTERAQGELLKVGATPRPSTSTGWDKALSVRILPDEPTGDGPARAGGRRSSDIGRRSSDTGRRSSDTGRRVTDVSAADSAFRAWADVSKINYLSSVALNGQSVNCLNKTLPMSLRDIFKSSTMKLKCGSVVQVVDEKFPKNVTSLMDEQQLWGCFYPFPVLYEEQYSPTVPIRTLGDLGLVEDTVLSREVVATCLSYLRRVPLLEDYVFIKLTLPYMNLTNIDVLASYTYLVYLDLQCNALSELRVLARLPFLQHLNVANNQLEDLLQYDTPQWYLSEVIYKCNSVKFINDLTKFWSITVLDLSNNNILSITGLESLIYLRRLDLSFNHIQRVENLNNLRLLWLDLSYNNISSFEAESHRGLCTMLHLKYLNLNENKLNCLKIFSGCCRLQDLYLRNNQLHSLLEVAVYMSGLRRLATLDTRGNQLQTLADYEDVVVDCFPMLVQLDGAKLDPVQQRLHKMRMHPDVRSFATRRLLRLLYVEQLGRARAPPAAPPADDTDVPLVVLVGRTAVGKGKLARRLAAECARHVELGLQHTTCRDHDPGHYLPVDPDAFDRMLVRGELLTYGESYGFSYGLSREQACVRDGRVRLVCMDLIPALMLQLRGRRPLLVLATCRDRAALLRRQEERALARSSAAPAGKVGPSTLQVMLSASYVAYGVLNEILMQLPDEQRPAFVAGSGCSLTMASGASRSACDRARISQATGGYNQDSVATSNLPPISSCSLYRDSSAADGSQARGGFADGDKDDGAQDGGVQDGGAQDGGTQDDGVRDTAPGSSKSLPETVAKMEVALSPGTQSMDQSKNNVVTKSARFSKSVSFTSEHTNTIWKSQSDITGMLLDGPAQADGKDNQYYGSRLKTSVSASGAFQKADSDDLWIKFLMDNGLLTLSDESFTLNEGYQLSDKYSKIITHIGGYEKPAEHPHTSTATTRMDLETIHRTCPGLFWDTVIMDDPERAFSKMRRIVRGAVRAQPAQPPLFDAQFPAARYGNVRRQLARAVARLGAPNLFL